MRDRLIKLLQNNSYLDVLDEEHWLFAAEQLLANGVVVIDTDVVSIPNRPLISQYMGRPIDEVINLIRKSEWISVDERLPNDKQIVLTIDSQGEMAVCFYEEQWKGVFQQYGGLVKIYNITHWMPLPLPPKEVKDD